MVHSPALFSLNKHNQPSAPQLPPHGLDPSMLSRDWTCWSVWLDASLLVLSYSSQSPAHLALQPSSIGLVSCMFPRDWPCWLVWLDAPLLVLSCSSQSPAHIALQPSSIVLDSCMFARD